jgi:hypothetical protein
MTSKLKEEYEVGFANGTKLCSTMDIARSELSGGTGNVDNQDRILYQNNSINGRKLNLTESGLLCTDRNAMLCPSIPLTNCLLRQRLCLYLEKNIALSRYEDRKSN